MIDSVSSLLVYAGFDRVYKFLHAVTNRIDGVDGSSVSLVSADTERAAVAKFETLFDGRIEVRKSEDDPEYRIRAQGRADEWRPLPTGDRTWVGPSSPTASSDRPLESASSLREMIDAVEATELTLTLCNYDGSEADRESLDEHFERLNVAVRTAELSTETPANVALLHRDSDVLAASGTDDLHAVVRLPHDRETDARPDVLEHVHRDEYVVADGSKLDLVRISRLIESRALGAGTGTVHAGFQDLSRLDDELGTRNLYEAIADRDVTVNLYGRAGDVPNAAAYDLHTDDEGELAESWFVVYDGGGRDDLKGALVAEENAPERFSGFWTYQPGLVDDVTAYLETTYG